MGRTGDHLRDFPGRASPSIMVEAIAGGEVPLTVVLQRGRAAEATDGEDREGDEGDDLGEVHDEPFFGYCPRLFSGSHRGRSGSNRCQNTC